LRTRSTGQPDTTSRKLGPFWLTPGVSPANAATLLYGGFSTIFLIGFIAFAQPYLMEAVLHIPRDQQGSLTGLLMAVQEAILILTVGLVGAVSDHIGRRIVYVGGLLVMTAGLIIYPLAPSADWLYPYRVIYAFGFTAATVMMHTCFAEYSQEVTRGRWMGLCGVFNALGAVLMATVLARLPLWYSDAGLDDIAAIRAAFWTVAAYALLLALVLHIGLRGHGPRLARPRESMFRLATKGLAAARHNPRLGLAYGMAFASRGDLAVLTMFFSLWFVQSGIEDGWSLPAATARAGMFFGMVQAIGMAWSFVMGALLDRIPRLTGVCVAFGLATVGYLLLGQVSDPFGLWMIPAAILVGMGEGSAMVSSAVLVGQEAPADGRGAALGAASLMGALGIMLLTLAGGFLFDEVGRTAPFTMMGLINFAVLAAALVVRRRSQLPAARISLADTR
jgi:MFS family permease